jgi:type I restriction enzyme, S subunit
MSPEPSTVPLGAVTSWLSGGTPNRANHAYWGGTIPWISAASLKTTHISDAEQRLTFAGLRAGSKLAPEGSILVLVRGMSLHRETRIGIADRPVSFNQDVKALVPHTGVLSEFLVYALQARSAQILDLVSSAGSGTGVLDTGLLKRLPIWLPDPREQASLVEPVRDAENAIGVLAELLAKKEAIKQGTAQELLTGHARLPGFSDRWSRVSLGAHVSFLKTVPLSRAQLDTTSAVRYLHYGDIHTTTDVYLDTVKAPMPRASTLLVEAAGRLDVGDLVLADASEDPDGVGKSVEITAVPPEGAVAGLHTIAARFDNAILADGFKGYLQFNPQFRRALLRLAAGTKVLATTRAFISSVVLDLPSVEEQQAVARVLRDIDDEIQALDRRLEKAKAIKRGIAQQLLTGRVRLPAREDIA